MADRHRTTGSFEAAKLMGSTDALDRVYGTLRTGQTARSVVANAVTRCEPALLPGSIYIFPTGYPAFTDTATAPNAVVVGELLWLSDLAATFAMLDAFEGSDFARVIRRVTVTSPAVAGASSGAVTEVWAWVYTLADPSTIRIADRLDSGDWVAHWRTNMDAY
jgi:gamma-glutamylcyclotransferase (GGCT)/AIG2-like uncharacterized protein YtfP